MNTTTTSAGTEKMTAPEIRHQKRISAKKFRGGFFRINGDTKGNGFFGFVQGQHHVCFHRVMKNGKISKEQHPSNTPEHTCTIEILDSEKLGIVQVTWQ